MSFSRKTDRPDRQPFFDRDGVLNVDHGYVYRPDQLEWIDGAREAVRLLNVAGYYVFVISNQSGIARGLLRRSGREIVPRTYAGGTCGAGGPYRCLLFLPAPSRGRRQISGRFLPLRKPAPGMLEQAAANRPYDLGASFLIGDKDDDVAAAKAFNIRGIKFNSSKEALADLVRREIASHPQNRRQT